MSPMGHRQKYQKTMKLAHDPKTIHCSSSWSWSTQHKAWKKSAKVPVLLVEKLRPGEHPTFLFWSLRYFRRPHGGRHYNQARYTGMVKGPSCRLEEGDEINIIKVGAVSTWSHRFFFFTRAIVRSWFSFVSSCPISFWWLRTKHCFPHPRIHSTNARDRPYMKARERKTKTKNQPPHGSSEAAWRTRQ
jgi:hypothetical protein